MGGMKISELDFLRLLPAFMRDDEAVIALAAAMDKLLGEPGQRLATLRTWDKIDELTEAECDEMAWELDIDWYDSGGMGLEEKRETIKLAQQIKRKRGTKWAVEQLINAYFGDGIVQEWHEMDGTPYTFVVLTTEDSISEEGYHKFLKAAQAAKNERSHLAGVYFFWPQGPDPGVEYALGSGFHGYDFTKCGTRHREAMVGLLVKAGAETEPEETVHSYGYQQSGDTVCGTYPQSPTVGAALKSGAAAGMETREALYTFPECGIDGFKATHGAAIVGTAVVGRAIVTD